MPSREGTERRQMPDISFASTVPAQKSANRSRSSSPSRSKSRKRKFSKLPFVLLIILLVVVIALIIIYFVGYSYYKDKFTANTYINGVNVSGKTLDSATALFVHEEIPDSFIVTRPNGETVELALDDINYSYSFDEDIAQIYNDIDRKSWFACLLKDTNYTFTDVASYDSDKLDSLIDSTDWGSEENQDAKIKSDDDGYYIAEEVQGDVFDIDILKAYIAENLDNAVYSIDALDSDAYTEPETVSADLEAKVETLNALWNTELNYDFDYTTETLTGKKLCKMVKVSRDGTYTVDSDACMSYIEELAEKYDTYNTERKFTATLQGEITVPTSDDAKYGWWLDQEECCNQLVELIEAGETTDIEPIYYETSGYVFTGLESARSAEDDIGDTYVEIDLTAQTFWYYEDGEMIRTGYIVSGQTTSEARTTLPGVYKVWYKATNYRMNDTNADGETWDTTCNYWTRVAIVGIGLHDTTSRTAFGGTIYKYNGSHGCINMTLEDAKFIYEEVAYDTPVVMYY